MLQEKKTENIKEQKQKNIKRKDKKMLKESNTIRKRYMITLLSLKNQKSLALLNFLNTSK